MNRRISLLLTLLIASISLIVLATDRLESNANAAALRSTTAPASITSTVYLPLIARSYPPPTVPYVLSKIQLPAGSRPHGIALDVAGRRAFVGNHEANTLSVIDTAAMLLSVTIPLDSASGPNGVAYDAELDRVYVANRDSNNLSVVDAANGTWSSNIEVGTWPDGVAVMDGLITVANFGSYSISIINAQSQQVTATLTGDHHRPALMAVNDDQHLVYVSVYDGGYADVLKSGQLLPGKSTGLLPYGIAYDQVAHWLYAANRGDTHTVSLTGEGVNWAGGEINVGQEPFVVGVNPRSGHIFVVCGDVVKVYDRRDLALLTTIPIGSGAEEGIAVDAERGLVYVTSSNTDEVTVIQDSSAYDIAFTSARDPQSGVYLMDDSGQHVHEFYPYHGPDRRDIQPAWSPDGQWLAFARNIASSDVPNNDQYWEIYLSDMGGQNQIMLTGNAIDDRTPAWSPDSNQVAWCADGNLKAVNADGSNTRFVITNTVLNCSDITWSPDGQWIAFVGNSAEAGNGIYLVPAIGGAAFNVSANPNSTIDSYPNWSPDSSQIAFDTDRDFIISGVQHLDNWEIYKVDINTLAVTRLTSNTVQDRAPVWSPDGGSIIYASGNFSSTLGRSQYDLMLMQSDGSFAQRVTDGSLSVAGRFSWSPDGRRIALQAGLGSAAEIYVIDIYSGEEIRLTNNSVEDSNPVWRPDTWK
jgi:YVTN family beta-propeller protein